MIKTIFIFKLIYINTAYIIFIDIDNITNFSNFTDNYFKYHYINIYIQKKNAF